MSLANFTDNSDFMVVSTNEVASIISRFTPEMIEDIINDAIQNKFRTYSPRLVNIVESIEQNYKTDIAALPTYANEIRSARHQTYRQIMSKICAYHNLDIVQNMDDIPGQLYNYVWAVYELLIANFNANIVKFFTNYIYKERATIYETLNLATKRKDASPYSKRIFNSNGSSKMAVIHANLEYVLENICVFDIPLEAFVNTAYIDNKPLVRSILSIIQDRGNFFKMHVVPYYRQNMAVITTNIRFALQGLSNTDINIV